MQIAKVTVLFKGGDKLFFRKYRSIRILSMSPTIFVNLVRSRLSKYFKKHSVLHPFQSRVSSKLPKKAALVEQKKIILKKFRDRKLTLGVYVDL